MEFEYDRHDTVASSAPYDVHPVHRPGRVAAKTGVAPLGEAVEQVMTQGMPGHFRWLSDRKAA